MKASSRRWPVQVFYNILDLAAINAWILYKETTGATIKRRSFILQLAEELSQPYVSARNACKQEKARCDAEEESMQVHGTKRCKCQVQRCAGNKTRDACAICKKAVCGACTANVLTRNICMNCEDDDNDDDNVTYSLD